MKRLFIAVIICAVIICALGFANGASAQQSSQAPQSQSAETKAAPVQQNSQAAPAPPSRSRSRTITGRVIDESNLPLEDAAIVSLPAGLINSPQSAATAAKIRPTSTDEQGKFVLENVSPGAYMIFAEVPGYVTAPDLDDTNREQKYYRPGDSASIRMIKGGVITGSVTSSMGEPVVGVRVNPIRMRDLKGRSSRQNVFDLQREWKTDDRGIYRIYGLEPGVYLISAGGRGLIPLLTEGYDTDAPTYYPSATRDNAAEVTVRSGEEMNGIDIRYRDNRGHAISGAVTGATAPSPVAAVTVVLNDAVTESFAGMAITPMAPGAHSFGFNAVPDGEYVLTAVASDYTAGSSPRRVTVKGADVTGLELMLAPYGSIEGRITLEQAPGAERKPECQNKRATSIEDTVILARLDDKIKKDDKGKDQAPPAKAFNLYPFPVDSTPNNKGEFKVPRLDASRYHVEARLPSEDWYVRLITLPPDPPATQPKDAAMNGIAVKSGERIAGMNITLAEGAAGARGRVIPATEGARLPAALRLHLIPAEKESADETLRFIEAAAQSDGSFSLANLPPGRYFVLARPSVDEVSTDSPPRPMAWDSNGRKQLRKEGEAANVVLELQPCQRVTDYLLRYKKQ
jgi:protocatechuate 3,4-dioxygenase beta subunit